MILQKVILEMGSVMGSEVHLSTPTIYLRPFHCNGLKSQEFSALIKSKISPTSNSFEVWSHFSLARLLEFDMKSTHLVPKRSSSSIHFHFRSINPKDLISYFKETTVFQITLINVKKT